MDYQKVILLVDISIRNGNLLIVCVQANILVDQVHRVQSDILCSIHDDRVDIHRSCERKIVEFGQVRVYPNVVRVRCYARRQTITYGVVQLFVVEIIYPRRNCFRVSFQPLQLVSRQFQRTVQRVCDILELGLTILDQTVVFLYQTHGGETSRGWRQDAGNCPGSVVTKTDVSFYNMNFIYYFYFIIIFFIYYFIYYYF